MICREDVLAKRHRRRRDSSVTIAVGSSLGLWSKNEIKSLLIFHHWLIQKLISFSAVLSVVTVMCYAIFRYVKIKAVGYDTMQ